MKNVIFLAGLLLLSVNLQAQNQKDDAYIFSYFKNNGEDGLHLAYSTDGFKWASLKNDSSFLTPVLSTDKLMRDPCIIRGGDGLFHMVWTVSWNDRGIGYARSKDLINWSDQQYIPVMQHEPDARNCWAPEITYDDFNKTYMIYWATTIPGQFSETDSKMENQYNHRHYFVTTKDFKTFSDTRLLYDPGFNSIDATIVKKDNKFVMFFKDETREPAKKNLRVAYSEALTGPYTLKPEPITGKYWAEGPTTVKIDNQWVVYFDKYTENKYGAVSSSDLENWTDISDKIDLPKGIRHGSILRISREELEKIKNHSIAN